MTGTNVDETAPTRADDAQTPMAGEAVAGAAGTSPDAAAAGNGGAPGPGAKVISIAPGTRMAMRVLLIIGACLVLLVPVGVAGTMGIVAGIDVQGGIQQKLPAGMKKLTVDAANFNVTVVVESERDSPRIDVDYWGGNPNKPDVAVLIGKNPHNVDLSLSRDGSRRLFGNVLADATVYLPSKLAKSLSLEVNSAYGSVQLYGDGDDGDWTGGASNPRWAPNGDEEAPIKLSKTFRSQKFADLKLYSESGDVSADGVAVPSADVASKSGNVSLSGKFDSLRAKTSTGSIRFNAAVRKKVRAVSTDGNIGGDLGFWRPYAQPAKGVDVQSYSGNVSLKVPRSGGKGEKGQTFKGYKVAVPRGGGDSNIRIATEPGTGRIPLHAESATGNVRVAYSNPHKGGK